MKQNKPVSLLLAVIMSFSSFISLAFSASADTGIVMGASTYDGMAAVYGNLGEDQADKVVNMLILKGDTYRDENIVYIDSTVTDENGNYDFRFACPALNADAEDGKIDNHSLYVKAEGEDVTKSVVSADVKGKKKAVIDIKLSSDGAGVQAVADVFNLYSREVDATIVIATYDKTGRLVHVSSPVQVSSVSDTTWTAELSTFESSEFYAKAFVWESFSNLIPLCNTETIPLEVEGIKYLVINPGASASDRNFAWYSNQSASTGRIIYEDKETYQENGNEFSENAVVVKAETGSIYGEDNVYNFVNITDLELGHTYVYSVGNAVAFSGEVNSFYVDDPDDGFSFGIISDIHARQNQNNADNKKLWDNTIKLINEKSDGEAAFILSAGDQITNPSKYEEEYDDLFYPELMKNIPFAPAMGITHDYGDKNYWTAAIKNDANLESKAAFHYNMPNMSETAGKAPNSIGDYWFRYGDALFVVINYPSIQYHLFPDYTGGASYSGKYALNRYTNMTFEKNAEFVKSAVNDNADAKWKFVMTHISPYPALGAEEEFSYYRDKMTAICEENQIDAVFSGHTHSYLRTNPIDKNNDGHSTVYYSVSPVKHGWDTMEGEGLTDDSSMVMGSVRQNVPHKEYEAKSYFDTASADEGNAYDKHSSMMYATLKDNSLTIKLFDVESNTERDSYTFIK